MENIASYIDHTKLSPTMNEEDLKKLCEEAMEHGFYSVCVPPIYISKAKKIIDTNSTKVCTVLGFPFGYQDTSIKESELKWTMEQGADEFDLVINLCHLKNNRWDLIQKELDIISDHTLQNTTKAIIETCYLNQNEKEKLVQIFSETGIDYLKTSTGYGMPADNTPKGALIEDIKFFKESLPEHVKIKASGGISDLTSAVQMIEAGASRLGCSRSVSIIKNQSSNTGDKSDY